MYNFLSYTKNDFLSSLKIVPILKGLCFLTFLFFLLSLHVEAAQIYWIDAGTDKIQRSNLDGTGVEDLVTGLTNDPFGIALDVGNNQMYWTETLVPDAVRRTTLDGGAIQDLITTGLAFPLGIDLDVGAGKMYWAEGGKIQRSNLDGTGVEGIVTAGINDPQDVAIDVNAGKIYWTDRFTDKIQRANLDGTTVEDLITTGIDQPSGIELDLSANKIYWTETGTGANQIQRANLDGTTVEPLVSGLTEPTSLALDVGGGKIYWTDRSTNEIQRANLDGSTVEDLITTGLGDPSGIALRFNSGSEATIEVGGGPTVEGGGSVTFDIVLVEGDTTAELATPTPSLAVDFDIHVVPFNPPLMYKYTTGASFSGEIIFTYKIDPAKIPNGLGKDKVQGLHDHGDGIFHLIKGSYNSDNDNFTFSHDEGLSGNGFGVAVQPEPMTLILLGSALLSLFSFRKKYF